MINSIRRSLNHREERKKLEEIAEDIEASSKFDAVTTSEAWVKKYLDFAIRVSQYNGYDHDLAILPPMQYKCLVAPTGAHLHDIEAHRVMMESTGGDRVYVTHSNKADSLVLVDIDKWSKSEDLSR